MKQLEKKENINTLDNIKSVHEVIHSQRKLKEESTGDKTFLRRKQRKN